MEMFDAILSLKNAEYHITHHQPMLAVPALLAALSYAIEQLAPKELRVTQAHQERPQPRARATPHTTTTRRKGK